MRYELSRMKYELKYVVPAGKLDLLREQVLPFVRPDAHMDDGGNDGYTVRSIYFDTPGYDYYRDKLEGYRKRRKVRIRGYNTHTLDARVFLEIKRKDGRKVGKNRAPLLYRDLGSFMREGDPGRYVIDGNGTPDAIGDSRRFLFHLHHARLLPVALVIYEREAYFGKYDRSFRLTFDKDIRGAVDPRLDGLYGEDGLRGIAPGRFVLEVKFHTVFPSWLKRITTTLGLRLGSFSKFTTCIDSHMTPWNRSRRMPYDYLRGLDFNAPPTGRQL